jgi:hypothetical protein
MKFVELQEQQRQQRLMLEKQLIEDQHRQAMLAARAAADKGHLVKFVANVRCWSLYLLFILNGVLLLIWHNFS